MKAFDEQSLFNLVNYNRLSAFQGYLEEDIPRWREVREEMENRLEQLIGFCDPVPPDEINEIVSNCITLCEKAEHKLRHTLHSKQVSIKNALTIRQTSNLALTFVLPALAMFQSYYTLLHRPSEKSTH